jgi:hypothetical protein
VAGLHEGFGLLPAVLVIPVICLVLIIILGRVAVAISRRHAE